MQISSARNRIVAVLGPTNTGKTHYALERMLGHESGMIGFPLRLLARENYDRALRIKGVREVALITGEEKILPPNARYFFCTVESMPLDRPVAFVGVDEIQMGADPDRGHIFTDRLLHARGTVETMFMGAETARHLIRRLVPEAEFDTRPRFSILRYAGRRKFTRLPARSAVVAFSSADVYAIAELIRRQRGGAAVVLGALSPRTRNAQVAMYQAGEVDYLVATDAIGMGLNMDVDHVAFAATRKFDGRHLRPLTAAELAQIAGRAGRHLNDGTFGVTADVHSLDPELVERIENHEFEDLDFLFWRNARLRYTSVDALTASLEKFPSTDGLIRARQADDERALDHLIKDPEILPAVRSPRDVQRLWSVCRIPDFGNAMTDSHTRLLGQVFRHLASARGRLPTDWIAENVDRLDRTDGDIDALTQRLAHIRTWTYISFHADWLEDADHWQGRTRSVEDALSDALHESLTKRFVDRQTAVLMRRLKASTEMRAEVSDQGRVAVEGHEVGHLDGFRFVPDDATQSIAGRTATHAAIRALRGEITRRIGACLSQPDSAFALEIGSADSKAVIHWQGSPVARIVGTGDILAPAVTMDLSDLLETDQRRRVQERVEAWFVRVLHCDLAALYVLADADVTGPARGLVYQVVQSLGSLARQAARDQIDAIDRDDRKRLRELGLRLGRESVFAPALLKPRAQAMRALLWTAFNRQPCPPPAPGRVSLPVAPEIPRAYLEAIGYRIMGSRAIRVDIVERLAAKAWSLSRAGAFMPDGEMLSLAGCPASDLGGILDGLGYRPIQGEDGTRYGPKSRRRNGSGSKPEQELNRYADSPFAKLRELARS